MKCIYEKRGIQNKTVFYLLNSSEINSLYICLVISGCYYNGNRQYWDSICKKYEKL